MSNLWQHKNHICWCKCLIVSFQSHFQIKQLETEHPVYLENMELSVAESHDKTHRQSKQKWRPFLKTVLSFLFGRR